MKNKKLIFNIVMLVMIAVLIVSGVMIVGNIKGWFGADAENDNSTAEASIGIANIERSGVAYSISKLTSLRNGDIIETKAGSEVVLASESNTFTLAENSEVKINSADCKNFDFELIRGEVFAVVDKAEHFKGMTFGSNKVSVAGTVFSANLQTGSSSIYVYEGKVSVGGKEASYGNSILFVGSSASVSTLNETSLNEFNLKQAFLACEKRELCFSASALEKVTADREAEIRKAAEEKAKRELEIIARGGTEKVAISYTSETPSSGGTVEENVLSCTLTIRCNTILDNMANLTAGKNVYVPANGVILATSTVQFVDGETVFEVLKRACSSAGIQLEYSWTPMYNSYYIEGINNLYEFDCGNESGWMYKVNGWFPNYGCSSYTLKDGDVIVWDYTCNGLGADVGGSVY